MNKGFSKKAYSSNTKWETWTTEKGEKIKVCDMTESHAKNVLNILLKRNKSLQVKLENFKNISGDFTKFLEEDKKWVSKDL